MPSAHRACECGSMIAWSHCCGRPIIDAKRQSRMSQIDRLPQPVRELVHQYGYTVVRALLDCGVKKPNQIAHIVETVLDEFSPTRGSSSAQGTRNDMDGIQQRGE